MTPDGPPTSDLHLANIPTPLDEAPRLSEVLGARILVKRDDLTGLAFGGNKARKLDYLLRDAIDKGCDTLVTAGGAQSNFCRMTAAAAARLGMECHLVLGGDEPSHLSGNLLLDRLFGAHMHFAGTPDWTVLEAEVQRMAAE
ncbi:MAG TPA: pyridoxal-phosphate dependent enzyme, partial [Dehalococcoidia bacterium]